MILMTPRSSTVLMILMGSPGFALTELEAGSDAHAIRSRAVQQPDGSWVLNGEKRYIGNGSKGEVFTTFARCEIDGKDRHIALILEKGMKGFEVGKRSGW